MLDAPRLRLFQEIVRGGSLRAAAAALAYTPSAVSQQLATLERESGATLVVRGPRGALLTDAGRALSRHVDAILARLNDAQTELDEIAGLRAGTVRVAAFQPPTRPSYRTRWRGSVNSILGSSSSFSN